MVCWLVGCLVVVVVVCLVGWLIYALTRIQKAKIYIKMEFHFISAHTERERESERQNMFGNIGVATATRTKLGTNSQHYIHIESGNQREKERARYIFMYNLSVCEKVCLFETNVATFFIILHI